MFEEFISFAYNIALAALWIGGAILVGLGASLAVKALALGVKSSAKALEE
jgi:hypothetical protein